MTHNYSNAGAEALAALRMASARAISATASLIVADLIAMSAQPDEAALRSSLAATCRHYGNMQEKAQIRANKAAEDMAKLTA